MKTLEQIKDEVAKENGLGQLVTDHMVKYFDQVAKRYAQQVAEKALADAAENASIDYEPLYSSEEMCFGDGAVINKDSILNTKIILP